MTLNREEQTFYSKLVKVGVPVLIQQLIAMGLNLADTIMVGKVSATALAAVGAANQVYFIYHVILYGVLSGAAVHMVQYWGIRDLKSLRKILGIDYIICGTLTVLAVVLAYFAAPHLISLFSSESQVIELGTDYLRIVCYSYIFSGLSYIISYNSRAIMDLKVATIINGVAIGINIVLNYVLIYGKLGLPELGVEGAALATLIARILEFIAIYISIFVRKEYPLKANIKEMMSFSKGLFQSVMKTAIPVICTEGLWALSIAMVFAAYGKISASALAVAQIIMTVTNFVQTIYIGVGNASSVIIGEALGRGQRDLAFRCSKRIMKICWILNVVVTSATILSRGLIAGIYDFDPETTMLLMNGLLVYAIATTPKMLAYMIICGILRAGDDNIYCLLLDVPLNMLVQVPLAFFSVMVLGLPLYWAMLVVSIPDFIKVFFGYQRYLSKKWMKVITDSETETDN